MTDLLPLEKVFVRKSAEDKSKFPRLTVDYVTQYKGLLNHLRANIYKDIDAGLAANSQLSGFYTAHNSEHFDEVVRYAGNLLGVENGSEEVALNPYELYILLVAIRIHDAGNIHGRQEHEKNCFSILRNCGAASGDEVAEKKVIALIAQAHGGKTSATNSKDTIGELNQNEAMGSSFVRARLIASIVRFADEICESRSRAANYLLNFGSVPKHSEIFHKYAASISSNVVSFREQKLTMTYEIHIKDAAKPWGCAVSGEKTETYLIDEILERLEKMDRERRYCNRFSRELITIETIRATIKIVDDNHDVIETIPVPELCDTGYPDDNLRSLKDELKEFCGAAFSQKLSQHA